MKLTLLMAAAMLAFGSAAHSGDATQSQLFTYALANRAALDCPQARGKANADKFVETFYERSTTFSEEDKATALDADDLFDLRVSVEGLDAVCGEYAPYFN